MRSPASKKLIILTRISILKLWVAFFDGQRWEFSEDEVIRRIKNHTDSFFTYEGGKKADVIVEERHGRKYLKTRNDGVVTDNLLSLKEC